MFPGCGPLQPRAGTSSSSSTNTAENQAALRAHHRANLTVTLGNISSSANSANLSDAWRNMNMVRNQAIDRLHLAIQTQIEYNAASQDADPNVLLVQAMRARLVSLCQTDSEAPPVPQAIVPIVTAPAPSVAGVAADEETRRVRQRLDGTTAAASSEHNDPVVDAVGDLMRRFCEVELGGDGRCLFCVFRYLQDREVGAEILSAHEVEPNEGIDVTRKRVVDHLDLEKDNLQDGAGVVLSAAMAEEFGSAEEYMAWIRESGSGGGYLEVLAWANLMQQRVVLHSTTTFADGSLHELDINPTNNTALRALHILHIVGRGNRPQLNNDPLIHSSGGRGGHYRFLQPNLSAAAAVVQIDSSSCASGNAGSRSSEIVHVASSSPS